MELGEYMNPEYEKELAAEIDRELKGLPELSAPRTLAHRVMRAIGRTALPWYRRSWQRWPLGLQAATLGLLLALFGALCYGGWKLPETSSFDAARHQVHGWTAGAAAVWNTLSVLLGAVILAVKNLSTGFLAAGLMAVAFAYALSLGLGKVCLRLASVRHSENLIYENKN